MLKKYLQKKLVNILVHNLFNMVDERDILRVDSGVLFYRNKPLSQEAISLLREQAEKYEQSLLWRVIADELNHQAQVRMFKKSMTPEDMVAGKLMLYLINLVENKMNEIKKL